jgi:hypothetical protein
MMNEVKERTLSVEGEPVRGTIIDLETIGTIQNKLNGLSKYVLVRPYLFGYLFEKTMVQKYVEKPDHIPAFIDFLGSMDLFEFSERPFFAYNAEFERGVFYFSTGKTVPFDGDIKKGKEGKEAVVRRLGIETYGDPFPGAGIKCIEEFEKGNISDCLAHNQACLLKEREILIREGYRNLWMTSER